LVENDEKLFHMHQLFWRLCISNHACEIESAHHNSKY